MSKKHSIMARGINLRRSFVVSVLLMFFLMPLGQAEGFLDFFRKKGKEEAVLKEKATRIIKEDKEMDQWQDDIERILNTLNETLVENKKLRDNIDAIQKVLEQTTIQNNVLNSRIRNLEKEIKGEEERKAKRIEDDKETQMRFSKLEQEKQELYAQRSELEDKVDEITHEKEEIMDLLSTAILEEERDHYKKLISDLKLRADQAIGELSLSKFKNETIGWELSLTYYRLGNVLFEAKNYQGALKHFKKAVEWNPSHSWAHHNMAIIYDYHLRDHPMAIHHYNKYLNLKDPEEEARRIRERILGLNLLREVVPGQPLRLDFNKNLRKTSSATSPS